MPKGFAIPINEKVKYTLIKSVIKKTLVIYAYRHGWKVKQFNLAAANRILKKHWLPVVTKWVNQPSRFLQYFHEPPTTYDYFTKPPASL